MTTPPEPRRYVGRGANHQPPNRFESTHVEEDLEQLASDDELLDARRSVPTEFLSDQSQSLIVENDSPDLPFRFSLNAYRGCEHGCAYCYARPYHEFLGMNAGIDFEAKILVKHNAPELLRRELNSPRWVPEVVTMSGVTDCYQPAERRFLLTRRLLEVFLEAHHPVSIITKNALVTRDLDVLRALAQRNLVQVILSVTTLDAELGRVLEPRTSTPAARLRAIKTLSDAGVPVASLVAPIIPGLTDQEIPHILGVLREAGALGAHYTVLRLPLAVRPIFLNWLHVQRPQDEQRVEARVRATRDGELHDSRFGHRMRGTGPYADQIRATFEVFARKFALDGPWPELDTSQFRPPRLPGGQLRLF